MDKSRRGDVLLRLCWALCLLWLPVYLYSVAQPQGSSGAAIAGACQGVLMLALAIMLGVLSYGAAGFCTFVLITAAVAFALEASSIATGFPFGFYIHNAAPGPSALGVPITVVTGYVVLSWYAWSLGRLIVRQRPWLTASLEKFTTPLVSMFVLAGFDYPYDPIGSTVLNMWTFKSPGGQFGVPLSNYLGWMLTGWVLFQLFALVEHRFGRKPVVEQRSYWLIAPVVWLGLTMQYPIMLSDAPAGVIEQGASRFVIADVYEAALTASLFSMLFVVVLAVVRLANMAKS